MRSHIECPSIDNMQILGMLETSSQKTDEMRMECEPIPLSITVTRDHTRQS